MPRTAPSRKLPPQPAAPTAEQPAEPPAAPGPAPETAPAGPTLRVGDYEVGEGFCPHLCGHPDIRY